MCVGCLPLQLNGDGCEEKDLYGCSARIPDWTRYAILICHCCRLEQRRCPRPRADSRACHKTGFHSSTSRTEHLGGLYLMVVSFEDPGDENLEVLVTAPAGFKGVTVPFLERIKHQIRGLLHIPSPRRGEEQWAFLLGVYPTAEGRSVILGIQSIYLYLDQGICPGRGNNNRSSI